MSTQLEPDREIQAITIVYSALKELEGPAQSRVIEYVLKKLNLAVEIAKQKQDEQSKTDETANYPDKADAAQNHSHETPAEERFTGISPVAQRWIQRNGFRAAQRDLILSLGGDEGDLAVKK